MNEGIQAEKIKNGDRFAFKIFFETHYKPLLAYIMLYSRSKTKAEDVAQFAFAQIWEKRAQIDPKKSLKSYLFRIARNRYLNLYDEQVKRETFFFEMNERMMAELLTEKQEDIELKLEKLRKIVESLPEKCRRILILNKYDGLKYHEIAEKLSISVKTVESQMRIAFQKIRQKWE